MAEEQVDLTREYLIRLDQNFNRMKARIDKIAETMSGLLQIAAAR